MKHLQPGGTGDYGELKGTTIKAANTRQAMPMLKELADRYLTDPDEIYHVIIHELIRHTLEFNRVIYTSSVFLTPEELDALDVATRGVGKFMQLLRRKAKEDKNLLWHITPKLHYMQHFPQEARLINPRLVQCYIEESYIGKMAQIWASSKNGQYRESIQYWALLKYLVWLTIELDL